MKDSDLLVEMIKAVRDSAANLRTEIANVRYGPPGTIYFDFRGETYAAKEPMDVMPVGAGEAGRAWCVKQLLNKTAHKI